MYILQLNYVNPGRVVLFNGIDSLYPSIELAPFAAQDLADLKNTFSGQFYHLSLKRDNAESTLALISQVVAESTPGMKLSGSFEAQYADIFTWENISYTSSVKILHGPCGKCVYVSSQVCVCVCVYLCVCVCMHEHVCM